MSSVSINIPSMSKRHARIGGNLDQRVRKYNAERSGLGFLTLARKNPLQ